MHVATSAYLGPPTIFQEEFIENMKIKPSFHEIKLPQSKQKILFTFIHFYFGEICKTFDYKFPTEI